MSEVVQPSGTQDRHFSKVLYVSSNKEALPAPSLGLLWPVLPR